jgi:hypothetical protein
VVRGDRQEDIESVMTAAGTEPAALII